MPRATEPALADATAVVYGEAMSRLGIFLLALLPAWPAAAQIKCSDSMEAIQRDAETRMSTQDFIKEVLTNEDVFAKALANYGYKLEISIQTLQGDTVDGEYRRTSTIDFDANGQRRETVTDGPVNTLTRIRITDREINSMPVAFTLTAAKVRDNDIVYSGRQRIGDVDAAVFDLMPRNQSADIQGFEGRTWVRVRDNAVMHLCGRTRSSPIAPMRYDVERALIDGKYWFPVQIRADEDARVSGDTIHVRLSVTYSDYKAR
jgi:hypothetical protein